jgi:hypothetical protein
MRRTLTIIILLIIILLPLQAQKSKDALYLRNGSIIYGKLLEMTDNQYKIQASDGSLLVYPAGDVEKFAKVQSMFDGRKQQGFGFAMEGGFLLGAQNTDYTAPFSFNVLVSYTIDKMNIISAGSGVEFLGVPFSPAFLEFKRMLTDNKAAPFLFIRVGKLLHVASENESESNNNNMYVRHNFHGGLSLAAGTGVSWSREDIELYLSFAYRYALTSYNQSDYNVTNALYKNSYNRLEIKFGFKF